MSRISHLPLTTSFIGLGLLLSAACLVSIVCISRLQSDLGEALCTEAGRLELARRVQLHLREYRVHTVVLAAGPSNGWRASVDEDRRQFQAVLSALAASTDAPDDRADLEEVTALWTRYEVALNPAALEAETFPSVPAFAEWTDAHHISPLLVPCERLIGRSEARMAQTLARSGEQSRLAERGLLAVGVFGPLAGLAGGYGLGAGCPAGRPNYRSGCGPFTQKSTRTWGP